MVIRISEENARRSILFLGEVNSGKSSLINAILVIKYVQQAIKEKRNLGI